MSIFRSENSWRSREYREAESPRSRSGYCMRRSHAGILRRCPLIRGVGFHRRKASMLNSIENVPAALALHQRPAIPNVRSTFGTLTELSNSLRLMYSRHGSHMCPNWHMVPPSMTVAMGKPLVCPVCGTSFDPPSAESFSFNSIGACQTCSGTGIVRRILLSVFENLLSVGATVIVTEHDLDMIRNADYIVDMGPRGGSAGGKDRCGGDARRDCLGKGKRYRKVSLNL